MQNEIKNIFRQENNFNSSKDNEEKLYMSKLKNMYLLRDNESGIVYTNNRILDSEIRRFKDIGITNEKREKELIVSLTSFPQRMKDIKYTLYSLLTQTLKPNKIILWLTESQFPNGEKDIPQDVLNLKNNGLSIQFYGENIRSYTKLVPALERYPNDIIVTADDDVFYLRDWLKRLYDGYLKNGNNFIYSLRTHRFKILNKKIDSNYFNCDFLVSNNSNKLLNFGTGVGGILYPPHLLYKDVTKREIFMKLAPIANDIWFAIMQILGGIENLHVNVQKILFTAKDQVVYTNLLREKHLTNDYKLSKINCSLRKNSNQLANILNYYKNELNEIYKKLDNSN